MIDEKPPAAHFTFWHWVLLVCLLAGTLATRLWRLDTPSDLYSDETYFGFTAHRYVAGDRNAYDPLAVPPPNRAYEWTHPPLGKLIIAGTMAATSTNMKGMRLSSADFGTAAVALVVLITFMLARSPRAALFAGLLYAMEGLNFVQSRAATMDIHLAFFILAAVAFYVAWRRRDDASNWLLVGVGLMAGAAIATKWTGAFLIALLAADLLILWLIRRRRNDPRRIFTAEFCLVILPAAVYMASYIHYFLMGYGWFDFVELQKQMWYYHTGLKATHQDQSVWWQWLLNLKPLWMYVNYAPDDRIANIYNQGNSAVLYFGLVAMAAAAWRFLRHRQWEAGFLLAAYLVFWLPWVASPRVMFFYHYLPSTGFLCIAGGWTLSLWLADRRKELHVAAWTVPVLALTWFVMFFPNMTAIEVPSWYAQTARWWFAVFAGAITFIGLVAAAVIFCRRENVTLRAWMLPAVLAAGVILRTVLAVTAQGYSIDLGTFSAWAGHAAQGLGSFYAEDYFADYPPGYIYVLWVIGKLRLLLGLDYGTPAFMLLLKSPAIIADTVTAWLLYRLALCRSPIDESRAVPRQTALEGGTNKIARDIAPDQRCWRGAAPIALAALFVLNPAVIFDSAVWGQVDSVFTVLVLAAVLTLQRRPWLSGALFAAALLVKPQTLIFAPIPLLWFALGLLRKRDMQTLLALLAFAAAGAAVFLLGTLPYTAQSGLGWIVAKYDTTLGSYSYATLNAFNLFALVGANGVETTETFLSLPYSTWGIIFIVLIVILAAVAIFRAKGLPGLLYVGTFLAVSVFVLSTKMHERYLYPALTLGLAWAIASRDWRAMWLYAGFSVTLLLNMAVVLALSFRQIYLVPAHDYLLIGVSIANIVLWLALASQIGCRSRAVCSRA